MPKFRASISFEEAPNGEALARLGPRHEFDLEAEGEDAAADQAMALAIERFADALYPHENAFCSGCECTEIEDESCCPDCGGTEFLPPVPPQIQMAWAMGLGWQIVEIVKLNNAGESGAYFHEGAQASGAR